jgi:hypothetical protein
MTERRRARSIDELQQKMAAMAGAAAPPAPPFRPRPDDVIISPFGKCGTTWLQQIFHTLRTRGDMDFDDISRVVPWIETAPLLGIDLNATQRAEPRGFKSHLSWDQVPRGARYIVSVRDPRDALVSAYRFMEGWFLEPGAVSIDEFAVSTYLRGPAKRYWAHLASWWCHRHDDDVLLLAYEHMHRDREGAIRRIAEFCGIALDEELLAITLEHSSLAFMSAHKDRFDDRLMRELSERAAGLPPGSDSAKVREGRIGGHRQELGAELLAELDAIWRDDIESQFGLASYQDLVEALEDGQ